MRDPRVYEWMEVPEAELAALVGERPASIARVEGGYTNTLHKVVLANGEALAVKHYAGGADAYATEANALRRLHTIIPVPEIVKVVEGRAIVYRWIDGITLDECRRTQPDPVVATLAEPLGRLLAWISRVEPPTPWSLEPALQQVRAQLADGRARQRLGAPAADVLLAAFATHRDAIAWGTPCLVHGDFGGRNVLVQEVPIEEVKTGSRKSQPVIEIHPRWRILGVLDWESAVGDSPFADIGSLFRYDERFSDSFIAAFERGYREADGVLPDGWLRTARLLDAMQVVDMLDEDRELPGVFADCRKILQKLAAEHTP